MKTNHVRCLSEFVESEIKYYTDCHKKMVELQYQLAQLSNQPNNQSNDQSNNSTSTVQTNGTNGKSIDSNYRQMNGKLVKQQQINGQVFKVNDLVNELVSPSDELPVNLPEHKKRARVLYDYQSQANDQLNLTINEIIIVDLNDTDDSDFLLAERGLDKGKVPLSYLEIMN